MTTRRAAAWILLFAVLAFAGAGGLNLIGRSSDGLPKAGSSELAKVVRVIDGDTVELRLGGKLRTVRYIGIDTPETVKPGELVQCFGKAASAYNRRLVEGKTVRLEVGRERSDRYGRLLGYIYLLDAHDTMVNASLVGSGYARTLTIAPNTRFAQRFAALQRKAQARNAGLWRACPR